MHAVNISTASLTVLCVFLLALFGSLAPVIYVTPACHARILRVGNAFAAGFLLSAALVHLLPSAIVALSKQLSTTYPLGGLLCLLGACSVYVLDVVARRIETCHKLIPVHAHNGHTHLHSPAVALVLAVSLSFHSLVEGVSLGVSLLDTTSFTALSIAILAHKLFAAVALGSALTVTADGDPVLQKRSVYMCVLFAAVTPVGAMGGVALLDVLSTSVYSVLLPAVNVLSSGVFLYVALVELLADQFRYVSLQDYSNLDPDDSLLCTAVFVAAAGVMSLLALWT
ncbi:Zinc transporter 6, chloroplastic [Gracilariopsis chorda]|uniref:Zinc transporter 6, chloroplastic n=1 Tax=Gracilariopsis chorda TaxID=448386 RepID=A0A2V3IGN6_9FLOR|nr:Zinc transporter 6, chloroplastic [Gracilariopsis chorda]|eukprot:PXF41237.1 Zinc transporter 6, chloroplastic [Gracilariopsis chorda]